MQRINKTYKIMIVAGVLLLFAGIVLSEEVQVKNWYRFAKEFIEIEKKMIQDEIEKKPTFLENFDSRDEAGKKFEKSPPPTEEDIKSLITSSNNEEISIGAVSIFLTKDFNPIFLQYLIPILGSNEDYFVKRYVLLALKKAPSEELIKYETKISSYILKEKYAGIIFQEVNLILKLTPDKSAKTLTELLGRDEIQIRRIAYVYLKKLGDNYLEEALEYLVKTKKIDKKKFVDEMRKRWE